MKYILIILFFSQLFACSSSNNLEPTVYDTQENIKKFSYTDYYNCTNDESKYNGNCIKKKEITHSPDVELALSITKHLLGSNKESCSYDSEYHRDACMREQKAITKQLDKSIEKYSK